MSVNFKIPPPWNAIPLYIKMPPNLFKYMRGYHADIYATGGSKGECKALVNISIVNICISWKIFL